MSWAFIERHAIDCTLNFVGGWCVSIFVFYIMLGEVIEYCRIYLDLAVEKRTEMGV